MRYACLALKKQIGAVDENLQAFIEFFQSNGYPIDELHILSEKDENGVCSALQALSATADGIFVFCDKSAFSVAKAYACAVFNENALRGEFGGACIFETQKSGLYLMSLDKTETGLGYAVNACLPFLQKKNAVRCDKMVVRAIGANQARVFALLAEAERIGGNRLRCYHTHKYAEDVIQICYDGDTPKRLADDVLRLFADGLGDTVYALNDVSLEEQLVRLLKLRKRKISLAESFTGGGIAKRITSVSGASEVYFEGLNTYDSRSKIKRLGVSEQTVNTFGAVSEQTAYEMAYGLLRTGDCDIALATTGLAGPNSDNSALPVGLCYLAVGTSDKIYVYRYKFDGEREEITQTAIQYALYLAYKVLKDL